jgi:hypothetical protein
VSAHAQRFALKGATLMTTWFENPYRPTRDLDLLGFGDNSAEGATTVFQEVCAIDAADGITFDPKAVAVDRVRDELEYPGLRLRVQGDLAGARVVVWVDIGFGDATEPGLETLDFPVLLDQPAPHLRAYARETVVAEKFQAMVALGRANGRMKDFYDVWMLQHTHTFDPERLSKAIAATFERRQIAIPAETPDALTDEFAADPTKQTQWAAFLRNIEQTQPSLQEVVSDLREFLMPLGNLAIARR